MAWGDCGGRGWWNIEFCWRTRVTHLVKHPTPNAWHQFSSQVMTQPVIIRPTYSERRRSILSSSNSGLSFFLETQKGPFSFQVWTSLQIRVWASWQSQVPEWPECLWHLSQPFKVNLNRVSFPALHGASSYTSKGLSCDSLHRALSESFSNGRKSDISDMSCVHVKYPAHHGNKHCFIVAHAYIMTTAQLALNKMVMSSFEKNK